MFNYRSIVLTAALAAGFMVLPSEAAIFLDSQGTGTENVSSDTTTITIDGAGAASAPGGSFADYVASGSVSDARGFSTTFALTVDAVAETVTTPGVGFGAKDVDGRIDRSSSGDFGVRDATTGGGIELGEGLILGLDASGLDVTAAWQLTGIQFAFLGGGEQYTVVNRNDTSLSLTGGANGLIDVSGLNLLVGGGNSDAEFASVFMNDAGTGSNFRIVGFEFEVVNVPEPASLCLVAVGGWALLGRRSA